MYAKSDDRANTRTDKQTDRWIDKWVVQRSRRAEGGKLQGAQDNLTAVIFQTDYQRLSAKNWKTGRLELAEVFGRGKKPLTAIIIIKEWIFQRPRRRGPCSGAQRPRQFNWVIYHPICLLHQPFPNFSDAHRRIWNFSVSQDFRRPGVFATRIKLQFSIIYNV